MNEYEVFVEDINSCGGAQYAKKELIEVEAESPEAYVQRTGQISHSGYFKEFQR